MTRPTPLVVIGAATALLEVSDLVAAINAVSKRYAVAGALDDDAALHGTMVGGVAVLGGLARARTLGDEVRFVFAISSYRLRLGRIDIFAALGLPRARFETLVHPRADVSPRAVLGHGCTVFGQAFVAPSARVGDFGVIYNSAFVSAGAVLGDFAMVAGLAFVGAGARLGTGAFAAGTSTVAPGVAVGPGGMVALASAAFADVPAGVTVLGNPAVPARSMPVPAHLLEA